VRVVLRVRRAQTLAGCRTPEPMLLSFV